jgi:hypothetical protein
MSNRITQADLEGQVLRINRLMGQPETTYTKQAGGSFNANGGNYHLDYAYGGVSLEQIIKDGSGAVRCISRDGHDTKRKLYNFMSGMIGGIEAKAAHHAVTGE